MRCRQELITLMQDQTLKADGRNRQGSGRTSDLPQPGVELGTRVHACSSQHLGDGCEQIHRIVDVNASDVWLHR